MERFLLVVLVVAVALTVVFGVKIALDVWDTLEGLEDKDE